MPDKKLSVSEFALKIKSKYPEYKDVDDFILAKKIVEKYPEYSNSVDLKKKDQPSQKGFGPGFPGLTTGLEPSRPSKPTVLTQKGLVDYEIEEQKAKAAAQKLSDKLNKNLATYYVAQGEEATAKMLNAKEQSNYNQLQAVIQKDLGNVGSRPAFLYNRLLEGTGSVISGAIDAGLNMMKYSQPMSPLVTDATILDYRASIAPEVKKFLRDKIGAEVDKGAERKYEEEFVTSALGGLAYSAPAMVTPYGVGLYTQAYDSGLDLINNAPGGKELTDEQKTLFAATLGAIVGRFEKIGLNRITGRAVAPQIARNSAFKAIKELGEKGVRITPTSIEKFASREANNLKNRLLNAGDQTYKAILDESATGVLQELGTVGLEKVVNVLKNKDIFEPQGMGEVFGRVLKAGAQEGFGGGVLGAAKGALPIGTKNVLVKQIANAKSSEDINKLLKDVESIGIENNYAPEEIENVVTTVNNIVQAKEKLPAKLTPAQQQGIIPLILERNELSDDLKEVQADLQSTDEAFAQEKQSEISIIENRINELNKEIQKISENEDYAVQEQATSEVPVQPEAGVGEEVAQGEPQAKPEEVTEVKEKITIGVAPFREINVSSLNEDSELRSTREYREYVKNISKIAKGLNLKVNNESETWGGYVDTETNRPVQEVSNMLQIEATPEEALVLAAILGKSAPEMQDSVLVGSFNDNGSGAEHRIKTGSFDNAVKAIEFLKQNGLEYFTIDKNTGDVIILDLDGSSTDNIINFNNQLNENGIQTEYTAWPVSAQFVGREDYDGILAEQGRKIGEERGFDIDAFIKSSSERYSKIKKRKVKAAEQAESGIIKRPAGQLEVIEEPVTPVTEEPAAEQKKLGASRIVGEAEAPVEFAEFEEVEVDLDKAKADLADSIETPFRNKEKLKKTSKSWVARFIKAVADKQYNVVSKLTKEGGDVGKIAAASLENRKGYSGPASIFVRNVNNEIFDNLSISPNVDIVGRKISESELFDVFLNLNRIINIDNRIAEKFSQLLSVDKKLKDLIASKSEDSAQIEKLQNEKDLLLDYLEKRKAIAVSNGEYVPVQYVHSGNRTAKTARAELAVIKKEQPELYRKFEDYAFKYNDFYRDLLELQYNNNLISKEVFDELFSYNYIPTKYIQHFIETELAQDNPALSAKLSSSIKNLTGGSDSDVITNFQAIIELYANSVYRKVYDNRASNALARNIFATSNNKTDIMKINQLVKDADAGINPKGIYSMNLNMFIQEPTGADKFGNPTYGEIPTGYDVIYFYRENGKRERIVAPIDFVDEWYERGGNLTPQGEKNLSRVSKWTLVNLFKALITKYNPTFGIFQITMDAPQALIASEAYPDLLIGSAQLAVDYAKVSGDIKKFITNGELGPLFKEALDAGIFSDFLSTENDIIRSQTLVSKDGSLDYASAAKILLKRVSSKVEGALQSVAQFNEAIEYMTRLAVYRRMKEKLTAQYIKDSGGAELTDEQKSDIRTLAAQQARNIVNFSRAGSIGKHANKLFAYLNAGIQGFYSVAKSLKNNPTKAAVMISEIGLAGVGLLAFSIGDFGDDEREKKKRLQEYLMLSDYQRANYFNIYNPFSDDPEKRWIKIYKPQPFRGWINFCEQGYLSAVHGIDIDQKEMVKTFMYDLPVDPSTVDLLTRNPMVNAAVKYSLNKDAFRSEDVVRNEEKIEDWAEGVDDKNVSKIYKNLGKATAGLFGTEGVSPKRAQAAVQSLVGDPSRNATTAFIDKGGKALFYLVTGDKEGLEQEFPDEPLIPFIARTVGVNARLFNKTPKLDNEFIETLKEDEKKDFTKRMIIGSEIESIFESSDSKDEAKKNAISRLKELVNDKQLTPDEANNFLRSQYKFEMVKDKPYWYKSLLSGDNEKKAKVLYHYTKNLSDKEYIDAVNYLIAAKIIAPEVVNKTAKLKQNAKQKK